MQNSTFGRPGLQRRQVDRLPMPAGVVPGLRPVAPVYPPKTPAKGQL